MQVNIVCKNEYRLIKGYTCYWKVDGRKETRVKYSDKPMWRQPSLNRVKTNNNSFFGLESCDLVYKLNLTQCEEK